MTGTGKTDGGAGVRLAELMSVMSIAADVGMGQPMEQALRSAVLAVQLGEATRLSTGDLRDAYYLALLRFIGCTVDSHIPAAVMGDEVAIQERLATVDFGNPAELIRAILGEVGRGRGAARRAAAIVKSLANLPKMADLSRAHCEAAQNLCGRFGLPASLRQAIGCVFERWDGRGGPAGLKGEALPASVRVMHVAQDAEVFCRIGGVDAAVAAVRERAGGGLDPGICETFCARAASLLGRLETESIFDAALTAEPGARLVIRGDEPIDTALHAMADYTDIKSKHTRGHSPAVARLAEAAALQLGLGEAAARDVRHAGLLHDLGRPGIPYAVWDKPGPLTEGERERVRLHAYYGERILARAASLAGPAAIAALDHERLDGSGYHRRLPTTALGPAARALSAADVYCAMTETRAYRPAKSADEAASELRLEARSGRLDAQAVEAVLAAAGHVARPRHARPGGLSDREIEVLRLVARGLTNKEVASSLDISAKTVGHHVQHIFDKVGVSTRAAATLFATQHGLV